ncbi:transketolase [Papillibacter cinnamivorans]|uniref:Transketolase n=1 Tax=Papillibacter cinnamivorans DSM 12816 TaxID=1122930 RepID=A0A1W2AAB9_9FIRM|nr:transketolase [Papillibacter cinnamivorans]SMC57665.1 transketolase [Papillibacter cinnamivorans DSM 12816]
MEKKQLVEKLSVFAEEIRLETLEEFAALGFGHVGGAMSVVETLAVLYGHEMKYDPKNPRWPDRDWLVLSKGHAGPALYATLSLKGFFSREMLFTLNRGGTKLPSHCDRNLTPGVDMTTGSLGQGISTAIGAALGNRMDGRDNYTYFILGDGECNEGQVWEGALFAPQHNLDHLIGFVDYNGQQLDGYTKDILDLGDIAAKFREFGWFAQEIDGHSVEAILDAVEAAKKNRGAPSMIVLRTKKGHGCTFAEGIEANHHIAFKPEQMEKALACTRTRLASAERAN